MTGSKRHQRGMGMTGIFVLIVLAIFFVTLLVRLGPLYLSNWTLQSVMEGVANAPEPVRGGRKGIVDAISRGMEVNDLSGIDPRAFKVVKEADGLYSVSVDYERRVPLFFNVDAVVTFANAVQVKTQ